MTFLAHCFLTAFAIALYFICGMPVVGNGTIVFSSTLLAATGAIVICINLWVLSRVKKLPIKNEDYQKSIPRYFGRKRGGIKESFLWRCLLAGIALLLIYAPHYRIILFNIGAGRSSISIDLQQFIRLFCFVVVVYLVQLTIRNFPTIRSYFHFYNEVKEATAPLFHQEPFE